MRLALAVLAVAVACNNSTPSGLSTGPGATTVEATSSSSGGSSSTSTSTSTSSGGEESTADSSGGVSTFDVPSQPDLGDPQPVGCKGKIDFIFVISALFTMRHEQDQLLASFPGFIETLSSKFADFDTHIISVNTDNRWRGDFCESPMWCGNQGNCGPNAVGYVCGSDEDTVWLCDMTRGAGLVFNAGPYAYNKPCDLYGGNRYIIAGEPNLEEAFECIAKVGTFGDDPPLADTLVEVVSSKLNGPGGCNAGFLRDDALLVFVFIMDTEDDESKLSATKVRDAVVAAKGGDEHSIVALAIVPQVFQGGEPKPDCTYNDPPSLLHLSEVIQQFPYHDEGDICADSYAPFFDQAVDLVFEACSNFIPQ